ncbi:MAG TPA: serine/threonine-protein kinase, partial [Pirellulaceae bacterium]|nr:serine/threonine-protein kinase [Pirellulaceae bacterium]
MEPAGSTIRPTPALLGEERPGSSVSPGVSRAASEIQSSGRVVVPFAQLPPDASPDDQTVISKPAVTPPAGSAPLKTMAALGAALVGQRLEHYDLLEFVGGGGMGAVFRALDTRLGRTVAVKVLSKDQTDDETIRRFRNEAQSAARLDHPNIARVYYVGEDRGWNFIVFEFIEGTNLREIVEKRGPLPLEDALHYTLQVAEALAHSSGRDVVHRDIKPSNVLVTAGDQVKLVDMGLARLHQVQSSSDDLTASGVTLGTFDYISPEQARDPRSADVRSDIYSLGCTLYYMLTGRPPFPDGTPVQKLIRHNSDEPPDVRTYRPDLPPRAAVLVSKMLAKRPSQRQQSAAELCAEILALGQQLGLPKVTQHGQVIVAAGPAEGQWRAAAWQVAAAVAVLAASVILVDAYWPSPPATNASLPPPRLEAPSPAPGGNTSANSAAPAAPTPRVATTPKSTQGTPNDAAAAAPTAAANSAAIGSASPDAVASLTSGLALPALEGAIGVEPIEAEVSISPEAARNGLSPPAAPAKISRLFVVRETPALVEPESEYVTSLAEACRRAAAHGLTEIELAFSGRLLERPLDILNQRLTLRAAPGARPVVVFQPPTTEQRQMLRLAGSSTSRLKAQGIEFRMELPDEVSSGWSLAAINTGQTLELYDCVLTVDASRAPGQDQVAMIAVQRRRAADTMAMADPQMAMAQAAGIVMERCIARGDATLVAMNDETPLSLSWTQGLLATSRRLIESGGSDSTARKYWETISIDLDSVTALCPQGLYLMQRRLGRSSQFAASVNTKQCILMTDPGVPLIEYIGVRDLTSDDLECNGELNRYPRADMVFLRTVSGVAGDPPVEAPLNKGLSSEKRAAISIPWLHPLRTDVPLHELTKSDFALDAAMSGGGGAGFDLGQLPDAAGPQSEDPAPPP